MKGVEVPVNPTDEIVWGSDAIAATIRSIGLPYVSLNPGASFRGLHDSLVNRNGNQSPQMLLCLHEESAVAIAHGYAKVTGAPMGVILHSNVGLLHGSMGIFNTWVDRVPVVVFGATGPVDAAKRRPWIDWIHTVQDQAALIRHFIKWDDLPGSVTAAIESIVRANIVSRTAPCGPTYVCLDAALQEEKLSAVPALPDMTRHQPPAPSRPSSVSVADAVQILKGAKRPMMLVGRASRDPKAWSRRVALADALGAKVASDLKTATAFPTDHPDYVGNPSYFLDGEAVAALREADVILSLDWVDLAGTFKHAFGAEPMTAKVIHASIDHHSHHGWGKEHHALPPVDVALTSAPDEAVVELLAALNIDEAKWPAAPGDMPTMPREQVGDLDAEIDIEGLAAALGAGLKDEVISFLRLPLGWDGPLWHFRHPLDYLGGDGGGGVGSGPGMSVGAALAMRDNGGNRLPVAVIGDGDFLMAASAIWTAVHYRIPLLMVVANNTSFYNDEVHQERVAKMRGREVQNKWIGQRISDPEVDIAGIARGHGAEAVGPVKTVGALIDAVSAAAKSVRQGKVVVIEARVLPGYSKAMATSMVRSSKTPAKA